jgi:hypothetical protein
MRGRDTLRFAVLLGMLASLLLAAPVLGAPGGASGLRLVFSGLYAAGVAAISGRRRVLWVGLALAVPALISEWLSLVTGAEAFAIANTAASSLFVSYTAAVILHSILRESQVTTGAVLGGLCIYLLIGIFFVEIFSLVELAAPGSFASHGEPLTAVVGVEAQYARYPALLYYSFVTLTTTGYGDIVPLSPLARSLAATEAVLGQLYLAVFIARLVGLHLAQAKPPEGPAQGGVQQ